MIAVLQIIILACQIQPSSTGYEFKRLLEMQVSCQKSLILCMDRKKNQLNAAIAFKDCLLER